MGHHVLSELREDHGFARATMAFRAAMLASARAVGPMTGQIQPRGCAAEGLRLVSPALGASPSGKAADFDSAIRRFESCRPSHY